MTRGAPAAVLDDVTPLYGPDVDVGVRIGWTARMARLTAGDGARSMQALAAAVGGKKARMADAGAAQRATGYVVGGISPLGQRTRLPVVVDVSVRRFDTVFCSGGRRGLEIELAPDDLVALTAATVAPIAG